MPDYTVTSIDVQRNENDSLKLGSLFMDIPAGDIPDVFIVFRDVVPAKHVCPDDYWENPGKYRKPEG
jgi:hypothetical protein